jgi:hypothetical protein
MSEHTYFLELPTELKAMLADNEVDLVAELRKGGLDVQRSLKPSPVSDGGKEVVLAITAIGLTAVAVASGIAKVIDALGRNKKMKATERKLEPALDASGRPIRDAKGNPVMKWSETERMVEATQTTQDKTAIDANVGGESLLRFSIRNG